MFVPISVNWSDFLRIHYIYIYHHDNDSLAKKITGMFFSIHFRKFLINDSIGSIAVHEKLINQTIIKDWHADVAVLEVDCIGTFCDQL